MRSELLIGGQWRQGSEDGRIVVLDPATDEPVAEVADGTPADAIAACDAAEAAQVAWAATAPRVRSEILRNCWQTMIDHTDELASLIVREHGKPIADAKGEITYSAEFFRWNAEETVRIRGEIGTAPGGANKIIVHHPPGRGRADGHPVELPGGDDHPQARSGAGRRQRGGDQAAPRGAADRAADRRPAAGGRACRTG